METEWNGKWCKNEWKMDQKCQLWTTLIYLAVYMSYSTLPKSGQRHIGTLSMAGPGPVGPRVSPVQPYEGQGQGQMLMPSWPS